MRYCACCLGPGRETKSYTVTGTMEPVARGVEVDMVMRSVTLTPFLCVWMGCVMGEEVEVALASNSRRSPDEMSLVIFSHIASPLSKLLEAPL